MKKNHKIKQYLSNLSPSKYLILLLGCTFLYTFLLCIQGFDMVDEGWYLTAYQQFFEHPQSAEYQCLYYNTILFGAVWNSLLGNLGILGFRILSCSCITLLVFIIYSILKQDVNRWAFFISVMIILFAQHYVMVFNHNLYTALLCSVTSLLLFKALLTRDSKYFFFAGAILGIIFFTRIPNLSLLSLSLVMFPFAFYTKSSRIVLRCSLWSILGVVIGILINFSLITILGHSDVFISSISSGFSAVKAGDSTHSIMNILNVYRDNYSLVFEQIIAVFFCPAISFFINKWTNSKKIAAISYKIILILYFIIILTSTRGIFTLYAFSYIILIIFAVRHYDMERPIYLIVISLTIMFFLPFGSDFGIGNMGMNCIWLGFPLATGLLHRIYHELIISKCIEAERTLVFSLSIIFFAAFAITNLKITSLGCYFDSGSRLKKTSRIEWPLANTFTTPEKCAIVEELLEQLKSHVKEKEYLLCWQCVPMVHYLTRTYPYLNTSWPWVYDAQNLEIQFNRAKENTNSLPVVLCNKSDIARWNIYSKDWDSETAEDQWQFNSRKIQLFHQFIMENRYEIVWENELFRIMAPSIISDSLKLE